MKLTTKKLTDGRYAVIVDGRETALVIERGEAPKYRQGQEWAIGVMRGGDIRYLTYDQRGKALALETVARILEATSIHRGFILFVSDRIAGRFTTKAGAQAEETRLCELALRDGHAITTRIRWSPPIPCTEQEAEEAALDATLY